MQLPDVIQYDTLMTALRTILPDLDPTLVTSVETNATIVTVKHRKPGTAVQVDTHIPVRHQQGSATEGGQTP